MYLVHGNTIEEKNAVYSVQKALGQLDWQRVTPDEWDGSGPALLFGAEVSSKCLPGSNWEELRLQVKDGISATLKANNDPAYLYLITQDLLWFSQRINGEYPERNVSPTVGLGFDIETTHWRFYDELEQVISWATNSTHDTQPIHPFYLRDILEGKRKIAGHNIKFDMNFLKYRGYKWTAPVHDTMVAAGLLNDLIYSNTLSFLTSRYTDLPYYKDMVDRKNMRSQKVSTILTYNKHDADASFWVAANQEPMLEAAGLKPVFDFTMELLPIYSDMETRGVTIDPHRLRQIGREVADGIAIAERDFGEDGVSLTSPKQLREVLYGKLGFRPIKNSEKSGLPSTDKNSLDALLLQCKTEADTRKIQALLRFRRLEALNKTFIKPTPERISYDGRLHTSYHLAPSDFGGTKTGRLSSSNPNLQNIPRSSPDIPAIRSFFVAPEGHVLVFPDYSQLELRVLASLSDDATMRKMFDDGWDIHTGTMSVLLKLEYQRVCDILKDSKHPQHKEVKEFRSGAKLASFLIVYGGGETTLGIELRKIGVTHIDPRNLLRDYLGRFPGIGKLRNRLIVEAEKTGVVRSPTGRIRHLPNIWTTGPSRWAAERQVLNTPIQGSASDICQAAILLLHQHFQGLPAHLLMNVHDQVAWEQKTGNYPQLQPDVIKRIMEVDVKRELKDRFGWDIQVPLVVDYQSGSHWR